MPAARACCLFLPCITGHRIQGAVHNITILHSKVGYDPLTMHNSVVVVKLLIYLAPRG